MTNAELAVRVKELGEFLIVAGYPEEHATRYSHISRAILKWPSSVVEMRREGRLQELPGVGELVALYIKQIIDDGVSEKEIEWRKVVPETVLELVRLPGLGPLTARRLVHEFGILSEADLRRAAEEGRFAGAKGIGPKSVARWLGAQETT